MTNHSGMTSSGKLCYLSFVALWAVIALTFSCKKRQEEAKILTATDPGYVDLWKNPCTCPPKPVMETNDQGVTRIIGYQEAEDCGIDNTEAIAECEAIAINSAMEESASPPLFKSEAYEQFIPSTPITISAHGRTKLQQGEVFEKEGENFACLEDRDPIAGPVGFASCKENSEMQKWHFVDQEVTYTYKGGKTLHGRLSYLVSRRSTKNYFLDSLAKNGRTKPLKCLSFEKSKNRPYKKHSGDVSTIESYTYYFDTAHLTLKDCSYTDSLLFLTVPNKHGNDDAHQSQSTKVLAFRGQDLPSNVIDEIKKHNPCLAGGCTAMMMNKVSQFQSPEQIEDMLSSNQSQLFNLKDFYPEIINIGNVGNYNPYALHYNFPKEDVQFVEGYDKPGTTCGSTSKACTKFQIKKGIVNPDENAALIRDWTKRLGPKKFYQGESFIGSCLPHNRDNETACWYNNGEKKVQIGVHRSLYHLLYDTTFGGVYQMVDTSSNQCLLWNGGTKACGRNDNNGVETVSGSNSSLFRLSAIGQTDPLDARQLLVPRRAMPDLHSAQCFNITTGKPFACCSPGDNPLAEDLANASPEAQNIYNQQCPAANEQGGTLAGETLRFNTRSYKLRQCVASTTTANGFDYDCVDYVPKWMDDAVKINQYIQFVPYAGSIPAMVMQGIMCDSGEASLKEQCKEFYLNLAFEALSLGLDTWAFKGTMAMFVHSYIEKMGAKQFAKHTAASYMFDPFTSSVAHYAAKRSIKRVAKSMGLNLQEQLTKQQWEQLARRAGGFTKKYVDEAISYSWNAQGVHYSKWPPASVRAKAIQAVFTVSTIGGIMGVSVAINQEGPPVETENPESNDEPDAEPSGENDPSEELEDQSDDQIVNNEEETEEPDAMEPEEAQKKEESKASSENSNNTTDVEDRENAANDGLRSSEQKPSTDSNEKPADEPKKPN